jgi:hypothetical protein
MRYEVRIRNRGVRARKGIVRLIGDIFKAFVYKIIAHISKGIALMVANQNALFRDGMLINKRITMSTGSENNNLIQATKYSSLEESAFFVRASLVAKKSAVKSE